ncbi:metallophosphoesterase [Sphaerisporangium sp. TRM90804]|uniref:metallophosphoesterase family protein n=1 Tax=Sphaerisporangium sp. TRM90804 TaxID=3031113 RepID=UPI00244C4F38|nr:metallophosphoesterase [Sphaerisporangium sp. TRM90804]MDH2424204.1 metallophosphoesterase [Sphaerisporangium sp. TRM90804]
MVDVERAAARGRRASSRVSEEGAGWACEEMGAFQALRPTGEHSFSWLHPRTLWRSRNEILAQLLGDPSNEVRRRWIAAREERGADPGFRVKPEVGADYSFLVIGDTGEGDASQYAVVPGLLKIGEDTSFAVVVSDVIYPTGSGNEYGDKFFRPYQDYKAPIYAIPGNHDWYDGLGGFMRVFCDAPALSGGRPKFSLSPAGLRGLLWRKPEPIDEARLAKARALRSRPEQRAEQPAPYWVIDLPGLMLVGIDTGITGTVDRDQGAWLRAVSADPRPKVLITGKPIYDRNSYHPCPIEDGGTVDDIVRDPAHNYVAAIGGDTHNYQRYPVEVDGRVIQYIVSGGGGAFTHATHTIRRVDVGGVHEDRFKCYPLRGDSLSFYSKLYRDRLRMPWLYLTPDEGLVLMSRQIGNRPPRPVGTAEGVSGGAPAATPPAPATDVPPVPAPPPTGAAEGAPTAPPAPATDVPPGPGSDSSPVSGPPPSTAPGAGAPSLAGAGGTAGAAPVADLSPPNVKITARMKWAARVLGGWPMPFRLPVGRTFHRWFSELSDWDEPPFFKSFLHVSVEGGTLRIRCFAATGCRPQEIEPPLEDEVAIPLTGPAPA